MIHHIRQVITRPVAALALRMMPNLSKIRRSMGRKSPCHRLLIIPPVWPASIGDEASLNAISDTTRDGPCVLTIGGYREVDEWLHIRGVQNGYYFRPYIWGGLSRTRAELKAYKDLSTFDGLLVVGTDVMDGAYNEKDTFKRLEFMHAAAATGMPLGITGISCTKNPSVKCMEAYRKLPPGVCLRARDPISKSRLEKHTGRNFELVADVAFLLEPETASPLLERCLRWIEVQKQSGKLVMILNLCTHIIDNDPDRLADALRHIRKAMAEANSGRSLAILLLPHDYRYKFNDNTLNEAFLESCANDPVTCHIPVMNTGLPITAREVKACTGMVDLTVTGRMHVAIASLGMGTPIACMTYQDKFEGLFEHFGLTDLSIDGKEIWEDGALLALIQRVSAGIDNQRATIARRLPEILRMAESNFADLPSSPAHDSLDRKRP